MKRLFVLAMIFACQSAQAQTYMIKGQGTQSCGRWITDRNTLGEAAKVGWVLGYITAYNEYTYSGPDVTGATDVDGIIGWMDSYCRTHPLESVAVAARNM